MVPRRELSCDRAAALVTRDPLAVCHVLMAISAGEAADAPEPRRVHQPGHGLSEGGSGLEKLTRMLQDLG